jgi:hypothetical protein
MRPQISYQEKMYEIAMAKEFGQEFVDKVKLLPDETDLNSMDTVVIQSPENITLIATV